MPISATDPVEGGCSNDYAYVYGDPVNQLDLDGRVTCPRGLHGVAQALSFGFVARGAYWGFKRGNWDKAVTEWSLGTITSHSSYSVGWGFKQAGRAGARVGLKLAAVMTGVTIGVNAVDAACSYWQWEKSLLGKPYKRGREPRPSPQSAP